MIDCIKGVLILYHRKRDTLIKDNVIFLDIIHFCPFARSEAPTEGRRAEGANLDRHLDPYHGKQGESNLASS